MTETTLIDHLEEAAWAHLERCWQTGKSHAFIDQENQVIDGKVDMKALIRAILAAMPEPTEVMEHAGMTLAKHREISPEHMLAAVRGAYHTIIEAAHLKKG